MNLNDIALTLLPAIFDPQSAVALIALVALGVVGLALTKIPRP